MRCVAYGSSRNARIVLLVVPTNQLSAICQDRRAGERKRRENGEIERDEGDWRACQEPEQDACCSGREIISPPKIGSGANFPPNFATSVF